MTEYSRGMYAGMALIVAVSRIAHWVNPNGSQPAWTAHWPGLAVGIVAGALYLWLSLTRKE